MKATFSVLIFAVLALSSLASASGVVSKVSSTFESSSAYWDGANAELRERLNIPYYFNTLYSSFAPLDESLLNQRHSESPYAPVLFQYREFNQRNNLRTADDNELGLRLIAVPGQDRMKASQALAESGLFETGDIVLSFRPEWYSTLRYSHIQLGISHAGVLYIEEDAQGRKFLKNLDMPLDDKHVGKGYLNSKHYLGAPFLHVVRPRGLNDEQKQNLKNWLDLLAKKGPKAYNDGQIRFNQNYADPKFKEAQPLDFVADIGRIGLGIKLDQQMTQFCSEFAWSILALKDCDPTDPAIQADFAQNEAPRCLNPVFEPMPVFGEVTTALDQKDPSLSVGMADGISLLTQAQYHYIEDPNLRSALQIRLMKKMVFSKAGGDAKNISSGHRAVEEALGDEFFSAAMNYYTMTLAPQGAMAAQATGLRQMVNAGQPRNYSPTAFMVQTLLPEEAPQRGLDYVGTLYFSEKVRLRSGQSLDPYEYLRRLPVMD